MIKRAMFKLNKNTKGVMFVTVMLTLMLMISIAVSASNMLLQDTYMIKRLKRSTQAQYLAEAGINDALATLAELGLAAKDNPENFPQKSLGEGTYDVTVIESGERVLLQSEGEVNGVTRTVALEVKEGAPTSLYYAMSSGSDFRLTASQTGWSDINGDIHANRNMSLRTLQAGWIDVDTCGGECCDGSLSATGTVSLDDGVTYHGSLTEGAPAITFPDFDYASYINLAMAGDDYYSGDAIWVSQTLNPTNGIIYVEGTATFNGVCHLYGGLVADKIMVEGELYQHLSGTRNVIVSRTNDIQIKAIRIKGKITEGKIETEEALVCAGNDFVVDAGSTIDITGILIAKRYLTISRSSTYVTLNHRLLEPEGLITPLGTGGVIEVVSWNR